jgi:hypothetical protein
VISSLPANGATNVAIDGPLAVTFSEPMDRATLTNSTMTLKVTATSANVPGIVDYNPGTNTLTFYPTNPLSYSTGYTVTVSTGVRDVAGNAMVAPAAVSITTMPPPDTTPPQVSSISPSGGATGVAVGTSVTIVFNRAMNSSTINSSTITLAPNGGGPVAAAVSFNAGTNTATLAPSSSLSAGTNYTLTITTGVQGSNNIALATQVTSSFTTAAPADNTPPVVLGTSPANGATNGGTSAVTVTFSEDMNPSTINSSSFTIAGVCGNVSYDQGTRTATFFPTDNGATSVLANKLSYDARVTSGVKDMAGNSLSSDYNFSFITEPSSRPLSDATASTTYSGTVCNGNIHVHMMLTQSGGTISYNPTCTDCYMLPLNQTGADQVGANSAGKTYAVITGGSGSISDSNVTFTFTVENGRQFTLVANLHENSDGKKTLSGRLSGSTLPPVAVTLVAP